MKWILLGATVVIAGMAFTQKPSLADTDAYYPWCKSPSGNCTYKTLEDCLRDKSRGKYQGIYELKFSDTSPIAA